jgi:general secretion pathway protein E
VRNAVRLVVAQRLVRRLCNCSQPGDVKSHALGLDVSQCRIPVGCDACHSTGYRGRALLAEWQATESAGVAPPPVGDERLWTSAEALVEAGTTSPLEVVRVLGLRR